MKKSGLSRNHQSSIELCCTLTALTCAVVVPPIFSLVTFMFPCRQFFASLVGFFYPQFCRFTSFHLISYMVQYILTEIIAIGWGTQAILLGSAIQV
ncbi:unnamed protein product [Orchesella dallaii]|uniref:Uncharacterized protein n=1 Tax=Orchesella dallaii TaxID=48710 RepID=A0ABP1RZT1_9HEXA